MLVETKKKGKRKGRGILEKGEKVEKLEKREKAEVCAKDLHVLARCLFAHCCYYSTLSWSRDVNIEAPCHQLWPPNLHLNFELSNTDARTV